MAPFVCRITLASCRIGSVFTRTSRSLELPQVLRSKGMTAFLSTAYSRVLGDELSRLRENNTSFGGRSMAVQLGWDPSKVSNIETGKARPTEVDLAQYLATCGKGVEFLQDFTNRYRHAFDLYFAQVPENLRTLVMVEN